jgi:hypothetical protein
MSNLAAYRTAVLALLMDAAKVNFTDLDVDQALRWALAEYSNARPLIRTYQFSVLATTGEHELPSDFATRQIVNVQLWNSDADSVVDLEYYAYLLDEQWIIHTKYQVHAGEVLQISYSIVHEIDDLDAAAGTTVPDADETLLQIGAAGHAALMRSLNRVETINMNPEVVKAYRETAADYLARFAGLLHIYPGVSFGLPDFPGDHPFNMVF